MEVHITRLASNVPMEDVKLPLLTMFYMMVSSIANPIMCSSSWLKEASNMRMQNHPMKWRKRRHQMETQKLLELNPDVLVALFSKAFFFGCCFSAMIDSLSLHFLFVLWEVKLFSFRIFYWL